MIVLEMPRYSKMTLTSTSINSHQLINWCTSSFKQMESNSISWIMPIERKLQIHQEKSLNHQPTNYPTSIQSPQPATTHQHPETRPHIPWRSKRSPVVLRRKHLANLLQWRRIVLRRWISHHHQRHVAIEPGKFSFSDQPNGASKRETLCICIRTCTKEDKGFWRSRRSWSCQKIILERVFGCLLLRAQQRFWAQQRLHLSKFEMFPPEKLQNTQKRKDQFFKCSTIIFQAKAVKPQWVQLPLGG